ncbi:MAG: PAS domain S-box protein [Pyrinomonadaceae bacterium]
MNNHPLPSKEKEVVKSDVRSGAPVGKILVVEDDPDLRSLLDISLQAHGYDVTNCSSGGSALEELRRRDFDLLLTDLMMPEMDGIALLKAALEIDPHLVGIIITGQGKIQTAVDAMQSGAFDYLLKPFSPEMLMPVLTRAMNLRHFKLENVQLRETLAIHSLCQTIAYTLDVQTVLSKLADAALQQSDADEVSVLLPTNNDTELYVAAVRGKKRERLLGERIPFDQSIASWVARERTPVILNGPVNDERFIALWPRSDIHSSISIPLLVANKLVGVINLNVTSRPRPFSLGQMKALTILASTGAAALESASLYAQVRATEDKYRSIFENATEGLFQATTTDRLLTVNPAYARIMGYDSPEEMITTITDIANQLYVKPEERAEAGRLQKDLGRIEGFEFEAYRKDGEKIWLSLNQRSIRNQNGQILYFEGSVEDITARRRIEEEKGKTRQQYEALVQAIDGIVWELDVRTFTFTFISKQSERVLGYTPEQWLSDPNFWTDHLHPDDRASVLEFCLDATARRIDHQLDYRMIAADGRVVWLRDFVTVDHLDRQSPRLRGVMVDITERKAAEDQLRKSEERYRDMVENAHDLIYEHDLEGHYLWANKEVHQITGYSREESVYLNLAQVVVPEYLEKAREMIRRKLGGERVTAYEIEIIAKDGHRVTVEVNSSLILKDGVPVGVRGIARDITNRKESESRQAAQYAITGALAESSTVSEGVLKSLEVLGETLGWEYGALWAVDPEQNVLRCVHVWNGLGTDADEFVAASRLAVFPPGIGFPGSIWKERQPLWIPEVNADPRVVRSDLAAKADFHAAFGFTIHLRSEVVGVVEFFSRSSRKPDAALLAMMVTIGRQMGQFIETKRFEQALSESEEQLRQSQKLEAIGQLAGGVAHDFNNLLTAINGYTELALRRLGEDQPLTSYLEEIKKAGERAANLTRQLLAFGRKQLLQPLSLDLNDVVKDMSKMLRRLIGENIAFVAKLNPDLKQIKADPGQVEQVLVNLVVNARDAMPSGGTLTIETANFQLDGAYAAKHVGVTPGNYVMLAVSDTGVGMDQESQARIFEPFFTTKEIGKGTGLGLSTVYGIVKQSGGNVWVYSEVKQGTTFKVYLPEIGAEVEDDSTTTVVSGIRRGSETVLLVEDEDMVRNLASEILKQNGFTVLEASGGEEAIQLCQNHKAAIDLLITDVVMPKMSGKDVAYKLQMVHPETKVLFMSGYTDEAIVHHGIVDSHIAFIQKPFSETTLTQKIREVLDAVNGQR